MLFTVDLKSCAMPRIGSAHSDSSYLDDSLLEREAELQRLTVQYRICSADRSAYIEEVTNQLQRDQNDKTWLQRERADLQHQLAMLKSSTNQRKDSANRSQLKKLGNMEKELWQEIGNEKDRHMELDTKIRDWEHRLHQQSVSHGGTQLYKVHAYKAQKRLRSLNDRLESVLQSYHSYLTENAQLREDIDGLRADRQRFDNLHRKLECILVALREEKQSIVEKSCILYEQRDEANNKIVQLREKSKKDAEQHETEMKELQRLVHHERLIKLFMRQKGAERAEDPQLTAWKNKFAELEAARKSAAEAEIQSSEAAFRRIQELSGLKDFNDVVRHFIETEEHNFAQFTFINELHDEAQFLKNEIDNLEVKISAMQNERIVLDQERHAILNDLDSRRADAARSADKLAEQAARVSKLFEQVAGGIMSLFNKASCDVDLMRHLLGQSASTTVNQVNAIQFLGAIEQRCNDLLLVRYYLKPHEEPAFGEGPGAPIRPAILIVPSVTEEFQPNVTLKNSPTFWLCFLTKRLF